MTYIQGFVIPVRDADKQAYLDVATDAAPFFAGCGATRTVECWADDVAHGKTTDFYRAVDAQEGESIVFSWIFWPDKAACDAAGEKMMSDEGMKPPAEMPFDGKRMIYAGFEPLYDTGDAGAFGYVDGIVASVPDDKRQEYVDFAKLTADIFKANGALRTVDGWGVAVPDGKVTDFKRAVQAKEGETVVFGWLEWPDKATRDAGMKVVMEDARMRDASPPWNGPTAIFGGFVPILDTASE